jgi:hypothetical protein
VDHGRPGGAADSFETTVIDAYPTGGTALSVDSCRFAAGERPALLYVGGKNKV